MSGFLVDLFADEAGDRWAELLHRAGIAWTTVPDVRSVTFRSHSAQAPVPAGARRLTFAASAERTLAQDPVTDGRLASLYLYQPRDRQALFDFDARITVPYAAGLQPLGELYGGAFDVAGLDVDCIGELSLYDRVDSREAQEAREQGLVLPDAILDIVAECRVLQDRDRARFTIWVSPARLSNALHPDRRQDIRLAGHGVRLTTSLWITSNGLATLVVTGFPVR